MEYPITPEQIEFIRTHPHEFVPDKNKMWYSFFIYEHDDDMHYRYNLK